MLLKGISSFGLAEWFWGNIRLRRPLLSDIILLSNFWGTWLILRYSFLYKIRLKLTKHGTGSFSSSCFQFCTGNLMFQTGLFYWTSKNCLLPLSTRMSLDLPLGAILRAAKFPWAQGENLSLWYVHLPSSIWKPGQFTRHRKIYIFWNLARHLNKTGGMEWLINWMRRKCINFISNIKCNGKDLGDYLNGKFKLKLVDCETMKLK